MKKLTFLMISLFFCVQLSAQNTVVLSQNKCSLSKISDLNDTWKEHAAPILNELVAQEKLINWGVLTHSWGDEWSWNVYYVAESNVKFLEAWGEFAKKAFQNDALMGVFNDACLEHKDSMYNLAMDANSTSSEEE